MWTDLRNFAVALYLHWRDYMMGGTVMLGLAVFQGLTSKSVQPLIYVVLAMAVFAQGAFLVWRDERRKVERENAETLYERCAQAIREGAYPLRVLMDNRADKLRTNEELLRLCDDLKCNGRPHPFECVRAFNPAFGFSSAVWLDFLRQARKRGSTLSNDVEVATVAVEILDARMLTMPSILPKPEQGIAQPRHEDKP